MPDLAARRARRRTRATAGGENPPPRDKGLVEENIDFIAFDDDGIVVTPFPCTDPTPAGAVIQGALARVAPLVATQVL